jgi:hypothetical protein
VKNFESIIPLPKIDERLNSNSSSQQSEENLPIQVEDEDEVVQIPTANVTSTQRPSLYHQLE